MVLMLISAWVYRFELTIDNPFVDWNKTGLFTSMASALLHSNSLEADFRHIYISTDHFLWRLVMRHLGVDLVWMKCILLHFHCIIFEYKTDQKHKIETIYILWPRSKFIRSNLFDLTDNILQIIDSAGWEMIFHVIY